MVIQDGPLLVVNGVITPVNCLIFGVTGVVTPISGVMGPPCNCFLGPRPLPQSFVRFHKQSGVVPGFTLDTGSVFTSYLFTRDLFFNSCKVDPFQLFQLFRGKKDRCFSEGVAVTSPSLHLSPFDASQCWCQFSVVVSNNVMSTPKNWGKISSIRWLHIFQMG